MTPEALSRTIVTDETIFLKNAKQNYAPLAIGQGTTVKINVNITNETGTKTHVNLSTWIHQYDLLKCDTIRKMNYHKNPMIEPISGRTTPANITIHQPKCPC
jgi:thiamine biosynthesis protein ThiC